MCFVDGRYILLKTWRWIHDYVTKMRYCCERSGINHVSSVTYRGLSPDIFHFSVRDIDLLIDGFKNRVVIFVSI